MGDIPDWLVELAAQRDEEDDDAEETEWDILGSDAGEVPAPESRAATTATLPPEVPADELIPDTADLDEGALIDVLRSHVDADEEVAEFEPAAAGSSFALQIPGLLPWQQLVLAALLLADIIVIGLLFLVMLGRMSIV